jgi:hypothetical protein
MHLLRVPLRLGLTCSYEASADYGHSGLWQTTGVGSLNARSLPPTSRSRSNASHRPTIAVTRESDYVPVGGFVSPVLVGVGVGDAVGAA